MANYPTTTGYQVLYPSAARGATAPTPAEFYANGRVGVRLDINVSAITGTSVTFTAQAYDPAANAWFDLLASTAKTSTGRFVLTLHPEAVASANVAAAAILPDRMRLSVTNSSITAVTYSAVATFTY